MAEAERRRPYRRPRPHRRAPSRRWRLGWGAPGPGRARHEAQAQRRLVVSHGARLPWRLSATGHPCRLGSSLSLLGGTKGDVGIARSLGQETISIFHFFWSLLRVLPLFCPVGTCRVPLRRPLPCRGMEAWSPHVRGS